MDTTSASLSDRKEDDEGFGQVYMLLPVFLSSKHEFERQ